MAISQGYEVVRVGHRVRRVHRIIVEGAIGRELLPHELVHHRNGNRLDNRPENLQVVTAREHSQLHRRARCKRGHDLTVEGNLYRRPDNGSPICLVCKNERNRQWRERAREAS